MSTLRPHSQHPVWTKDIGVIRSEGRTLRLRDDALWVSDAGQNADLLTQLNTPEKIQARLSHPLGYAVVETARELHWAWELSRPVSEEIADHCSLKVIRQSIFSVSELHTFEGEWIDTPHRDWIHPERELAEELLPLMYFPWVFVAHRTVELVDCREPALTFIVTPQSLEIYHPITPWTAPAPPVGSTVELWKRYAIDSIISFNQLEHRRFQNLIRRAYQYRRSRFGYCEQCGVDLTPAYNFLHDGRHLCTQCAGIVF